MPTPPRLRRYIPPTPEERAEQRARADELRAQHETRRAAERTARLSALQTGPTLRDVAAAAECCCNCHPRMADTELHDGGVSCPCQQTPEERRAAFDVFVASQREWFDSDEAVERRRLRDEQIAAAIAELDVEIDEIGGMAPFVITGRVDGHGFYLRERHEAYRIVVAPDSDPTADVWAAPVTMDSIEIAAGPDSDLGGPDGFDEVTALRFTVAAVRLFLLRRSCDHANALRFCPTCGVESTQAAAWREIQ